jgi:hypothetical protein
MEDKTQKTILSQFKFLNSNGFLYKEKIRKSTVGGGEDTIEYVFTKNTVIINISFYQFVSCCELSITVFKLNENKSFSFEEYLLTKSYNDYFSQKSESTLDYISRIAELFYKESKDELKDVLDGQKWIEVPRDYSRIR